MSRTLKQTEAEIEYLELVLAHNAPMGAKERQDLKDRLFELKREHDFKYSQKMNERLAHVLLFIGIVFAYFVAAWAYGGFH